MTKIDVEALKSELGSRPKDIKTFKGMPSQWSTKRKLRKFGKNGWEVVSSARSAVYSRKHDFTLQRPKLSKAERKALGWK